MSKESFLKSLESYGKNYKPDTSGPHKPMLTGKYKRDAHGIKETKMTPKQVKRSVDRGTSHYAHGSENPVTKSIFRKVRQTIKHDRSFAKGRALKNRIYQK